MLQTLWFRARSELQFASVHPSTYYCTPTANWLNSCLLPEDALYQWDSMRCIFLTKFQVLSQAFWIWALYAMQVVEAVRHALCESESEVNELRKASEHCQEVREPGSSRALEFMVPQLSPIVFHRVPCWPTPKEKVVRSEVGGHERPLAVVTVSEPLKQVEIHRYSI